MPRRERERELARRRRRKKERRKLRAKGLLPTAQSPKEILKEAEKKKPEKALPKETPPVAPKEGEGPSTQEA